VVAVGDEDVDAGLGEPVHLGAEPQLGAQALVGGVVGVAGDDEERRLALEAHVDDAAKRLVGRVGQLATDARVCGGDALERRIEMQVGGVNEPHG